VKAFLKICEFWQLRDEDARLISDNPFLSRVVLAKKNVCVTHTLKEVDWRETKALREVRCWIGVPLIVGDLVLGLLSIGNAKPRTFTMEHFRLAKLLAVPIALVVRNARLREWAAIYAAERESLIKAVGSMASG
jgi:GAF domain-containing protein